MTSDDGAFDPLAATAEAPTRQSRPVPVQSAVRPQQIGRYQIERELGAGGMGVVYAAFDPELERRVALKVLKGTTADGRSRLVREARALAKLTHPNVVTVHEVGSVDGVDFVAMELVEGEPLGDWLAAAKRTPAEILEAFRAAGTGLAAAHAVGLVHRDFKPHNVLRARDGRIMVVDFGLARASADDAVAVDTSRSSLDLALTAESAWIGTPAYMSPEQWNGGAITPAVDQFAFCVALWEALTGVRPFTGTTLEQIRQAVSSGPPPGGDAAIPRAVRPVLRRGLEPDPAKRWPSMQELLAALAPPSRSRRPAIRAALALLVPLAVLAVWVSVWPRHDGAASAPENPAVGFTKIAGRPTHATPAAIKRLIAALRAHNGAKYVPAMKSGVPTGVKLYALSSGTVLDAAGLVNGDTIVAIDDHPTPDLARLDAALDKLSAAPATLTLHLQRAGRDAAIRIDRDVGR